jgi:hypothetical protein
MKTFDIRRSLEERLPGVFQRIITWLSGLPASGATLRMRSEVEAVLTGFATFWAGALLGTALARYGDGALALLPVASTITVGAARYLQLSVYHHCAHDNVISAWVSLWIGRAIASMLVIERFDVYAPKHCKEHHGRHTVSTRVDATVQFLVDLLCIAPGAPVEENRRRFLRGLVSPRVHARMLANRLASQFGAGASWGNRLATGGYLVALAATAVAAGMVLPFLIGFVLPVTFGYQVAQIARLMVEHRWAAEPAVGGRRSVAQHDELTVAVRCVIALPTRNTPITMAMWSAEMAFNVLIRCTVLPGDSGPAHQWHHGQARGDWVNYIQAAAAWEEARRAKGLPPSTAAWGYRSALRMMLESFAAAKPESLAAPALYSNQLQQV